ncbi:MAG: N-acetylneuraminate synthase [Chitinophagia bacterium]
MKENNVIIIAEAGVNHNGDIKLAKKLVDIAAESGADYVKFQTWITEDIVDYNAPKAEYQLLNDGEETNQFEMLKNLELSFIEFKEIKKHCESQNIKFLSTPDDETSLNFLCDELKMDLIKIGSGEINNIQFLRKVAKKNLDVILSTGMSGLGEIEAALNELLNNGAKSVSLLHCTSNYPAKLETVNLKAMHTMRNAFKTIVGYSDHTEGISISIAAVALGAKIIEKHFTIDKNMKGPDHKASMSPIELFELVKEIRNVEKALTGSGKKEMQQVEVETKKIVTKGLYLKQDICQGEIIYETNIIAKRPLIGLSVKDIDMCVGKRINKNKNKGDFITLSDLYFD